MHHRKSLDFLQKKSGKAIPYSETMPIRKNLKKSWQSRIIVHSPGMMGIIMERNRCSNDQPEVLTYAADRRWMRIEQQGRSMSHSAGLLIMCIPYF